jgi:prepilin-type N-terminal cleavage/methylation domain-containing protein
VAQFAPDAAEITGMSRLLISRRNRGFTLIELVAVIVILGVLSVTVTTAFVDLRTEARNAKHNGVVGAFGSAFVHARQACRAFQTTPNTLDFPRLGDGTLDFDSACVPMGTSWVSGSPGSANFCREVAAFLVRGVSFTLTAAAGQDYLVTESGGACTYAALDASGNPMPVAPSGTQPLTMIYVASGAGQGTLLYYDIYGTGRIIVR